MQGYGGRPKGQKGGRLWEAGGWAQQAAGRRQTSALVACSSAAGTTEDEQQQCAASQAATILGSKQQQREAHRGSQAVDMRIAASRHNVRQVGALGQAAPRGAGGGDSRLAQPVGCPVCWGPAARERYLCQLQYSTIQHTGRAGKVRWQRVREGEGSTA